MADFSSESLYIADSQSTLDRMTRINNIIIALENQMIVAAGDVNIADYSLNDGQINIRTAYRSPETIAKAINMFDSMYQRMQARLYGTQIVSLRDARSFNNRHR